MADERLFRGAFLRVLVCLFIICIWPFAPAAGQEEPLSQGLKLGGDGEPIEIRADRLKVAHREGKIEFFGKVVATRGDITIHSKELRVLYHVKKDDNPGALEAGRIKSITAEGDVRIVQGDRVATGARADYFEDEQKIVLTGSPRIWQGKSFVSGKKVVVFLEEERSEVLGDDDEPVRATILTPKRGQEKSPKTNE